MPLKVWEQDNYKFLSAKRKNKEKRKRKTRAGNVAVEHHLPTMCKAHGFLSRTAKQPNGTSSKVSNGFTWPVERSPTSSAQ